MKKKQLAVSRTTPKAAGWWQIEQRTVCLHRDTVQRAAFPAEGAEQAKLTVPELSPSAPRAAQRLLPSLLTTCTRPTPDLKLIYNLEMFRTSSSSTTGGCVCAQLPGHETRREHYEHCMQQQMACTAPGEGLRLRPAAWALAKSVAEDFMQGHFKIAMLCPQKITAASRNEFVFCLVF